MGAKVVLTLSQYGNLKGEIKVIFNSGSQANIISSDQANNLGLEVFPNGRGYYNVDNEWHYIEGKVDTTISVKGKERDCIILVSQDVGPYVTISFTSMIRWGVMDKQTY